MWSTTAATVPLAAMTPAATAACAAAVAAEHKTHCRFGYEDGRSLNKSAFRMVMWACFHTPYN